MSEPRRTGAAASTAARMAAEVGCGQPPRSRRISVAHVYTVNNTDTVFHTPELQRNGVGIFVILIIGNRRVVTGR
jgi:hypothetical protein